PRPRSIADVRSDLAEDEALLATLTASGTVYVWVITREDTRWNRVPLSAEDLAAKVSAIRRTVGGANEVRGADSLDDDSDRAATDEFARQEAFEVYEALLAPFAPILSNVDHLYAVVDGSLASLPFSLLLTQAPAEGVTDRKPLREAPFLLHQMAVTTLPSITSLSTVRGLANSQTSAATAGFIGFGDPLFAGVDAEPSQSETQVASLDVNSAFRSGGADAIRSLAQLPGTRRELNDIANVFGPNSSSITLGADASETAVKEAPLTGASVIAFATHGLLAGELDGLAEPALVFTPPRTPTSEDDGLLTASEVAALDLDAEWVILSACNTAGSDGTPGAEGLSGLAQAFLFAGARSILVSHWPVRDDAAARLTVDTLAALRDEPGLARSEALRRAMVKMIEDERDPSLAHPSAWAPFVLVGDGGKRLAASAQ
ncbi:MAG: CHAT domain-containing protein, partial [Pseudomonadota bacterium]